MIASPPRGSQSTLGDKLSNWWLLANFKAFQLEVIRRFKTEISLRQRNDWEALLKEERIRVQQLGATIAAVEGGSP